VSKSWELRKPRPIHHKLAELYAQGLNRHELRQHTGLALSTISRLTNSQLFLALVDRIREREAEARARAKLPLKERVEEEAVGALEALRRVRDYSGSDHARLEACKQLLGLLAPQVR
jgi:hypothetical protein